MTRAQQKTLRPTTALVRTLGTTMVALAIMMSIHGAIRPASAAGPAPAVAAAGLDQGERAGVLQAGFKYHKGHGFKKHHGFGRHHGFRKHHGFKRGYGVKYGHGFKHRRGYKYGHGFKHGGHGKDYFIKKK